MKLRIVRDVPLLGNGFPVLMSGNAYCQARLHFHCLNAWQWQALRRWYQTSDILHSRRTVSENGSEPLSLDKSERGYSIGMIVRGLSDLFKPIPSLHCISITRVVYTAWMFSLLL